MALLLTKEDVMSVLDMKECIEVVEKAFLELINGTAVLPLRTGIFPGGGVSLYMPAYLKELGALACKVVTVYKNNPQQFSLPVTIGKVLLQNPDSGEVIAIMDGGYLTAVRTGAASGVASKYLARKGHNLTAGIFGTGVQAKKQLEAVAAVRDIAKAIIFDISAEAAENYRREMSETLNIEINTTDSPDDVLAADIICTATSAKNPVFDGSKVRPGTHINGIGSHTPDARELDTNIVKRSKFVGDSHEACFSEAGDIIIPVNSGEIEKSHFYGELGELISGKKSGRVDDQEITIFKSNGLAIQDAATAKLVYDKALAAGIGNRVEL